MSDKFRMPTAHEPVTIPLWLAAFYWIAIAVVWAVAAAGYRSCA